MSEDVGLYVKMRRRIDELEGDLKNTLSNYAVLEAENKRLWMVEQALEIEQEKHDKLEAKSKKYERLLREAKTHSTSNAWWQDVKALLEADDE